MIYICSIIEGFKVTLGCFPIQASMLAILVGIVGPNLRTSEESSEDAKVFWVLVASHSLSLCLVLINMIVGVNRPKVYMLVQCINIISLFAQNLVIIYLVQALLLALDDKDTGKTIGVVMKDWLRIEVCIFIAYIAASIIFLLVRSCTRH